MVVLCYFKCSTKASDWQLRVWASALCPCRRHLATDHNTSGEETWYVLLCVPLHVLRHYSEKSKSLGTFIFTDDGTWLTDWLTASHTAPVSQYRFGPSSDLLAKILNVDTLLILVICSFTFLILRCYFITGGALTVHSSMLINDCWTRCIHIYPNIRWPMYLRYPLVIFWLVPEKSIFDFVRNYKVSCQHPPHFQVMN